MVLSETKRNKIVRLPLNGEIDLTYRCNNNCLHCWLIESQSSNLINSELSFDEIRKIVLEARSMGCRTWCISGGEPMLRPDFADLFDFITSKSKRYTLNSNGTLITPKIANLMKRVGSKMIALYGATPETHDFITQNPGSFESTIRGISYLKEANAGFIVQLIIMKDNFHEYQKMIDLAESLGSHYRISSYWLYCSASFSKDRNDSIKKQRLSSEQILTIEPAIPPYSLFKEQPDYSMLESKFCNAPIDDSRLFHSCIKKRTTFHIDPYGQFTFCSFVKDPELMFDLKNSSFAEAWDKFLPEISQKTYDLTEYRNKCGRCKLRPYCDWCMVFSYLEHKKYTKEIQSLCDLAKKRKKFVKQWKKNHRKYFKIAGVTIQVESLLPILSNTYSKKFKLFETKGPGSDTISFRLYFKKPELKNTESMKLVYDKTPWRILRSKNYWIYQQKFKNPNTISDAGIAVFNKDHSKGKIFNPGENKFLQGNLKSLTVLFNTDQILLARILADRQAFILHSAGMIINNHGFLFAGHSDAGKSTIISLLKHKGQILCDDRNVIRCWPQNNIRVYGSWSHGDVQELSSNEAPLKAICFIEQSKNNELIIIQDKKDIMRRLILLTIKPMVTKDWWEKIFTIYDKIVENTPFYILRFNKHDSLEQIMTQLIDE